MMIFLLLICSVFSIKRYVFPTDTFKGDCTNETEPCSLLHAVNMSEHGDTIVLSSGLYTYDWDKVEINHILKFKGSGQSEGGTMIEGNVEFICEQKSYVSHGYTLEFWNMTVRHRNRTFLTMKRYCSSVLFYGMNCHHYDFDLIEFDQKEGNLHEITLKYSKFSHSNFMVANGNFTTTYDFIMISFGILKRLYVNYCTFGPEIHIDQVGRYTLFGINSIKNLALKNTIFKDSTFQIYWVTEGLGGYGDVSNVMWSNMTIPKSIPVKPTFERMKSLLFSTMELVMKECSFINCVGDKNGPITDGFLIGIQGVTIVMFALKNSVLSGNSDLDKLLWVEDKTVHTMEILHTHFLNNSVRNGLFFAIANIVKLDYSIFHGTKTPNDILMSIEGTAVKFIFSELMFDIKLEILRTEFGYNQGHTKISKFEIVNVYDISIHHTKSTKGGSGLLFSGNLISREFKDELTVPININSPPGTDNPELTCPEQYHGTYYRLSVDIRKSLFEYNTGRYGPIKTEGLNVMNISDCIFRHNSAMFGGAVYLSGSSFVRGSSGNISGECISIRHVSFVDPILHGYYEDSGVNISDCEFLRNEATEGGAIYITGKDLIAIIRSSNFVHNQVRSGGSGGDIFLQFTTDVLILDSVFNQTIIKDATNDILGYFETRGAVDMYSSDVRIEKCKFVETKGRAIYSKSGSVHISSCEISSSRYGGISLFDTRERKVHDIVPFKVISFVFEIDNIIENTRIENCVSSKGSAIVIRNNNMNQIRILHTKIVGNSAFRCGGGVFVENSQQVFFSQVMFVNNSSPVGSAFCTMEDTIHPGEIVVSDTTTFSGNKDEIMSSVFLQMSTTGSKKRIIDMFQSIDTLDSSFYDNNVTAKDFSVSIHPSSVRWSHWTKEDRKNNDEIVKTEAKNGSIRVFPGEKFGVEIEIVNVLNQTFTRFYGITCQITIGEYNGGTPNSFLGSLFIQSSSNNEQKVKLKGGKTSINMEYDDLEFTDLYLELSDSNKKIKTVSLVIECSSITQEKEILVEIQPCPPGFKEHNEDYSCTECQKGSYSIVENAESCHTCPVNSDYCSLSDITPKIGYKTLTNGTEVSIHFIGKEIRLVQFNYQGWMKKRSGDIGVRDITNSSLRIFNQPILIQPGDRFALSVEVVTEDGRRLLQHPDFVASLSLEGGRITSASLQERIERGLITFKELAILTKHDSDRFENLIVSSPLLHGSQLVIPIMFSKCLPGTKVRIVDEQEGIMNCEVCPDDYYSLTEDSETCFRCCKNCVCDKYEVFAEEGYWISINEEGEANAYFCDSSNCLGSNACKEGFDPNSPLCASCKSGHSYWNNRCVKCDKANGGFIFLYVLFLLFQTLITHFNSQDVESTIEKSYAFFGQLYQFSLRGVDFDVAFDIIKPMLQFIFGFALPSIGDSNNNVLGIKISCPYPRSSYGVIVISVLEPVFYGSMLLLPFLIFLCFRCGVCNVIVCFMYRKYRNAKKKAQDLSRTSMAISSGKDEEFLQRDAEDAEEEGGEKQSSSEEKEIIEESDDDESELSKIIEELEDDDDEEEVADTPLSKVGIASMLSQKSDDSDDNNPNSSSDDDVDGESDFEEEEGEDDETEEEGEEEGMDEDDLFVLWCLYIRKGMTQDFDECCGYRDRMNQFKEWKQRRKDEKEKKDDDDDDNDDDSENSAKISKTRRCLGKFKENMIEKCIPMCWTRVFLRVWIDVREKFIDPFTSFNAYRLTFINIIIITFQLFVEKVVLYFSCKEFNEDEVVMVEHTDVKCTDNPTYTYLSILFYFLAFYCVSIPIIFLLFLYLNRKKVISRDEKFVCCYGTLFSGYRDGYVGIWYESFSMLRKIVLVFFMSFSGLPNSVSQFCVTAALFFCFIIHILVRPYRTETGNILEGAGLGCVIVLQLVRSSTMYVDLPELSLIIIIITFVPTFLVFSYFKVREILILYKLEEPFLRYLVGFCCLRPVYFMFRLIWNCKDRLEVNIKKSYSKCVKRLKKEGKRMVVYDENLDDDDDDDD